MQILTWNIQFGKGVDGAVDLGRIARHSLELGRGAPPDVICFQEVAVGYPELDGGAGGDQSARLAAALPGYRSLFRAAVDRPAGGQRFGNMLLSRLPVHDIATHLLPEPPAPGRRSMRRIAIEATVGAPWGPLTVFVTHLAYHDEHQRAVQAARLRELHAEAMARLGRPGEAAPDGPFAPAPRAADVVICGDFNFVPDAPPYAALVAPFDHHTPALLDAWRAHHGARPHDLTCNVHQQDEGGDATDCRDFFFVTPGIADRIVDIAVDSVSEASDHQPVLLVLRD